MDLIIELGENYSDKVGSAKGFDGNFVPLTVPSSVIGALRNICEQTADVEIGEDDKGTMESLGGLRDALNPILEFNQEEGGKRWMN